MSKDATFNTNKGISSTTNTSSSLSSSATKLQITPMSPLTIQTLKNGFLDRVDLSSQQQQQNGRILLHPKHVSTPPPPPPSKQVNNKSATSDSKQLDTSTTRDNVFLHKVIAHDGVSAHAQKALNPRNTVVKQSPGGTVQITYKNMINMASSSSSHHHNNNNNNVKNNPVFILPKPVNGTTSHHQVPIICNGGVVRRVEPTPTPPPPPAAPKHNNVISDDIAQPPQLQAPYKTISDTYQGGFTSELHQQQDMSNHSSNTNGWLPMVSDDAVVALSNALSGTDVDQLTSVPNVQQQQQQLNELSTVDSESNLFNGIDIDLSYLDVEPFDVLQQFYSQESMSQVCPGDQYMCTASMPVIQPDTQYMSATGEEQQNHDIPMSIDQSDPVDFYYPATPVVAHQIPQTLKPDGSSGLNCELKNIIDVSPELAVSGGGIKIILIGSWNAKDARYTCQFGSCFVDAVLIQNGVLRCYSPKHKPGAVRLSVLCNNVRISKEVDFTFVESSEKSKWPERIDHNEWLSITNKALVHLLVERISFIAEMVAGEEMQAARAIDLESDRSVIEDKLLEICKGLMALPVNINFDYKIERTMTVLHLSSALGYIKLIQLLMNWVESNPNKIIQAEACPTCLDQFSLIPIMWSSAKGHFNTTCVLHQWSEPTIEEKDACGCTALSLATENGHESLVEYLGRLLKKSTISRLVGWSVIPFILRQY